MSWSGKRRRETAETRRTRLYVLQRDRYRCQLRLPGCTGYANISDHIVPLAEGGSDAAENQRAVCSHCHDIKTEQEKLRGIKRYHDMAKRPEVVHPLFRD